MVKDREAWHAAVHGVSKSHSRLSNWTTSLMDKKTGSQLNQQHLCKSCIISLTVILEIPDTCFLAYFPWIAGCLENHVKMFKYRRWFVVQTAICSLKIHSPILPWIMKVKVLLRHIALSLKTTFPPSLEDSGQILAYGMWAKLLHATSGFIIKRKACVLPWPFFHWLGYRWKWISYSEAQMESVCWV